MFHRLYVDNELFIAVHVRSGSALSVKHRDVTLSGKLGRCTYQNTQAARYPHVDIELVRYHQPNTFNQRPLSCFSYFWPLP